MPFISPQVTAQKKPVIPRFILCVDPGKRMGVVELWLNDSKLPPIVIFQDEVEGTLERTLELFQAWFKETTEAGADPKNLLLVCEDWDSRDTAFSVDARLAVEPMAWLKLLAHQHGVQMITARPQQRLGMTDETIKAAGYWLKGGLGHKRSALRHGLAYLVRSNHIPTLEKLWPRTDHLSAPSKTSE